MQNIPTRMEVNAAIDHLLSGKEEGWLEAARIVVRFGLTIPQGSKLVETLSSSSEDNETASGYAAGIGNVTIYSRRDNQPKETQSGQKVERAGYYKLTHGRRNITFWNYRDSLLWRGLESEKINYECSVFYDDKKEPHTVAFPIWEEIPYPLWHTLWNDGKGVLLGFRDLILHGKFRHYRWQALARQLNNFEVLHSIRTEWPRGAIVRAGTLLNF